MYKTDINDLIADLTQETKDAVLKEIIIDFRKHGNDSELGKSVRNLLIKKIICNNE